MFASSSSSMLRHGFREDRDRSRRRWRIVFSGLKWATMLAVFAAIGYYAYATGTALADRSNAELRAQVGELTATLQALRREHDTLGRDFAGATAQVEELRKRYAADVPTGPLADVMRVANDRLAGGVDPKRLASVIGLVENARRCDDKPVSRRFLVRTARATPGNDTASFGERTVTVTASGEAAVDAEGRPQSWFEPSKPVTVTFTRIGGKETEATGILPLHHSVVVNDTEHRFVVTPGDARGFVAVTGESCRYP